MQDKLTFIDFFAGVGGFRRGMELAGHECVGFCEFDKYAIASYTAMHTATTEQLEYIASIDAPVQKNGVRNFKNRREEILKGEYRNGEWFADDVRRVDAASMPRADCWCFGFPCQDISIAGKQLGFRGNRSSLFFAVTRIIRDTKEEDRPKYVFIENVKNLLSINRGGDFLSVLIELDEVGYDAEWQVINSKDYGVPQNRERVFIVGHLRGKCSRAVFPLTAAAGEATVKQIGKMDSHRDNPNQYRVYDKEGLGPCLSCTGGGGREPHIIQSGVMMNSKRIKGETNIATTLMARDYKGFSPHRDSTCVKVTERQVAIPVLTPDRETKRQNGRRFKEDGEPMFTLTSQDRHGVLVKEATKKGYAEAHIGDSVNLEQPNSKTRRGRVGKGVAQTLTTGCQQGVVERERIRKLTPREYFRLQGWTDDYFEKAAMVNSDSQLYKQAGNGVTVTVIKAIAERLEK